MDTKKEEKQRWYMVKESIYLKNAEYYTNWRLSSLIRYPPTINLDGAIDTFKELLMKYLITYIPDGNINHREIAELRIILIYNETDYYGTPIAKFIIKDYRNNGVFKVNLDILQSKTNNPNRLKTGAVGSTLLRSKYDYFSDQIEEFLNTKMVSEFLAPRRKFIKEEDGKGGKSFVLCSTNKNISTH